MRYGSGMDRSFGFEKVGTTWDGSPVYLVTDAVTGDRLGVIERCRVSTDGTVGGSGGRIRRPGKGRNAFRPAAWFRYDRKTDTEEWSLMAHGATSDTRTAAAETFVRTGFRAEAPRMPEHIIDQLIERAERNAAGW
jgi:hypothetical protein